jgi:hypothetical protein
MRRVSRARIVMSLATKFLNPGADAVRPRQVPEKHRESEIPSGFVSATRVAFASMFVSRSCTFGVTAPERHFQEFARSGAHVRSIAFLRRAGWRAASFRYARTSPRLVRDRLRMPRIYILCGAGDCERTEEARCDPERKHAPYLARQRDSDT